MDVQGGAEIDEYQTTIRSDQDVGRLDVSMHDAAVMEERHDVEQLVEERPQRVSLPGRMEEGFPLDETHRKEGFIPINEELVKLHEVRVNQPFEKSELAFQQAERLSSAEMQHLDRDAVSPQPIPG